MTTVGSGGNSCTVLIPLAGSFMTNKPAVFGRFGDSTPLVHCLRTMLHPGAQVDRAVVCVAQPLFADVLADLEANPVESVRVVQADGAGTREDCLRAGLSEIEGAQHVLVHDVRRPLASIDLRDRVVKSLTSGHAMVVPTMIMVDSVKAVDSHGTVTDTVDRSTLLSAQFPRGVTTERLKALLAENNRGHDFDELEVSLENGYSVDTVDGDPDAFLIEIPRDIVLAEAIVSCRRSGQR